MRSSYRFQRDTHLEAMIDLHYVVYQEWALWKVIHLSYLVHVSLIHPPNNRLSSHLTALSDNRFKFRITWRDVTMKWILLQNGLQRRLMGIRLLQSRLKRRLLQARLRWYWLKKSWEQCLCGLGDHIILCFISDNMFSGTPFSRSSSIWHFEGFTYGRKSSQYDHKQKQK
jgi:hypothetical protein